MTNYIPCPKCESTNIHPVKSRQGNRCECRDCGYAIPVDTPGVCLIREWEKPFIEAWNTRA